MLEARRPQVTADDHGPILAVATWFLMVALSVAVLIRVAIRVAITRTLGNDDWTAVGAMIIAIAQAIAISIGIQDGWGKKEKLLTGDQLISIEKAQYTAELFFMVALTMAKVSVLQLLNRLAVVPVHTLASKIVGLVTIVWGVAGFLTLAFQCSLPEVWNQKSTCLSLRSFWIGMAPVDVMTELYIIILPILMMAPVQVARSKKVIVIMAFVWRVCVIIATIVRLFFMKSHPSDLSFDTINSSIITQTVLSVSIFTSCIPSLKPFLDSFESGGLAIDMRHQGPGNNSSSYKMNELSYVRGGQNGGMRSQTGTEHVAYKVGVRSSGREISRGRRAEGKSELDFDRESGSSSPKRSDEMIIKRTDQWTVRYEPADPTAANMDMNIHHALTTPERTRGHGRDSDPQSLVSASSATARDYGGDGQRKDERSYV